MFQFMLLVKHCVSWKHTCCPC